MAERLNRKTYAGRYLQERKSPAVIDPFGEKVRGDLSDLPIHEPDEFKVSSTHPQSVVDIMTKLRDEDAARQTGALKELNPHDERETKVLNRSEMLEAFKRILEKLETSRLAAGSTAMSARQARHQHDHDLHKTYLAAFTANPQGVDLKNYSGHSALERQPVRKMGVDLSSPLEFFFGRENDRADGFVDFLLEEELSAYGMQLIFHSFDSMESSVFGRRDRIQTGSNASFLFADFNERENLFKLRESIAARAEAAAKRVAEKGESLREIREKEGELEALRRLAEFAYKDVKYEVTKNDMLSVFDPEDGNPEANCDGRARAISVLLQEMGYRDDQILWECFTKHVRVIVRSKRHGELLLEGGVKSWERGQHPGRIVFDLIEIGGFFRYGRESGEERAGDSAGYDLVASPLSGSSSRQDIRTSPVSLGVFVQGATEVYEGGDVSEAEDPDMKVEIVLGDPAAIEKQDAERRKLKEKRNAERHLRGSEALVVQDELKRILHARIEKFGNDARALVRDFRTGRFASAFSLAGKIIGGFTLAGAGVEFGSSFLHDAQHVAEDLQEKTEKSKTVDSGGTGDMEIFMAEFDSALEKRWERTFSDIDYLCRLNPIERSWPLADGKSAKSASFVSEHDAAGFHDTVTIYPTKKEKEITGTFWSLMKKDMDKEGESAALVERLVDIHSADPKRPLKASGVLGELSEALPTAEENENARHALRVQLDGAPIADVHW